VLRNLLFATFYLLCSTIYSQGDTPCTATTLTPSTSCSNTLGTLVGSTSANNGFSTPLCANYSSSPDVWYKFTAPAGGVATITLTAGTLTDSGMSLYSATDCSTPGSELYCDDDGGSDLMSEIVATGLTGGSVYYIRVWDYDGGSTGDFNICITEPAPPPSNDEPCSATTLTANLACSNTSGTTIGATSSAGVPAPGCANYTSNDVWFKIVVPASGGFEINTSADGITDSGIAVYSGACGGLTLVSCDDNSGVGSMSKISLSGQTAGTTMYIRVWSYGSSQSGTFNICAVSMGACGNVSNNDYCSNPATLTKGASSWNSATTDVYSSDTPDNLDPLFCGSIENNSWYKFTASAASETFNFTSVYNCSNADGIQAEVYSLTTNGSGCCSVFTSKSNCWNPGIPTTGTVTATGLTIGQNYYLMVDGYGGDACDFTVSGWSASGILLPVELISFNVYKSDLANIIRWSTASEIDNDYFIIEKSVNGFDFESIGKVKGHGTSTRTIHYELNDYNFSSGINYYRLKQYDINGNSKKTKVISIDRNNMINLKVYPNPTNNYFNVEVNEVNIGVELVLINQVGEILERKNFNDNINGKLKFDLKNYNKGVYYLKAIQENGAFSIEKIILQ